MKRSDMTYIIGAVFASMVSLFYCSIRWFHIQLPRYYPLERTWKWANEKGVPSQGWYAMQAFAFLCAGLVSVVVWLVLKKLRANDVDLGQNAVRLLGITSSIIMLFGMVYILFYEYNKWGVF